MFPLPGKTQLELTAAGLLADDITFLDLYIVVLNVVHNKDYNNINKYIILQIILTQEDGRVHTTTIKTTTAGNDMAGITFRAMNDLSETATIHPNIQRH